jgi:hypothetical protein
VQSAEVLIGGTYAVLQSDIWQLSGAHKVSLIPQITFKKLSQAADPLGTTCEFSVKIFANYKRTKADISGRVV